MTITIPDAALPKLKTVFGVTTDAQLKDVLIRTLKDAVIELGRARISRIAQDTADATINAELAAIAAQL